MNNLNAEQLADDLDKMIEKETIQSLSSWLDTKRGNTPEDILHLQPNQVFVFGSNTEGIHGSGAARAALRWGAVYGNPIGRQGQTYAIVTKDLNAAVHPSVSLSYITEQLVTFFHHAAANPEEEFLLTKIGCGLAGFEMTDIVSALKEATLQKSIPPNILIPKEFSDLLTF